MSKIINNAEKKELADNGEPVDVICSPCVGQLQKVALPSTGLFNKKIFVKWVYMCTNCQFRSKEYVTNIRELKDVTKG